MCVSYKLSSCFYISSLLVFFTPHVVGSCHKEYNQLSGIIKSPGYPNGYQKNIDCVFNITVQTGYRINLKWKVFRVNGLMRCITGDYVRVSIGCSKNSAILNKFCNKEGSFIPNDIYSIDECMMLEFHSDENSDKSIYKGFYAEYTTQRINQAVPQSSKCNTNLYARSGIIKSPNWPLTYYKNISSASYPPCTWKIDIPDGYGIQFLFMNMDTYAPNLGSRRCYIDGNDYLKFILKQRSTNRLYDFRFCNRQPRGFSKYYTTFKSIEISFEVNTNKKHSYKGFMVGYSMYTMSSSGGGSSVKWWYIVVPLFVFIFFIWYCRKKSRENGGVKSMFQNKFQNKFQTEYPANAPSGQVYPMPTSTQSAPYTIQTPGYAPPSYQQILTNDETINTGQQANAPPYQSQYPSAPPPSVLPPSAPPSYNAVVGPPYVAQQPYPPYPPYPAHEKTPLQ